MSQAIFLRGAKQLLTLRGRPTVRRGAESQELAIISDGSVLIRDGKIVSVGSTRRLENLREARAAIDVPVHGHVVMPGFVDPGIRLSLFDHSKKGVKPRRRKMLDLYESSLALMRSCLQYGTLTAGIRAYSGLDVTAPDVAMLRQLARIGDSPVGMVRIWEVGSSNGYPPQRAFVDALQLIRKHQLASLIEWRSHSQLQPLSSPLPETGMDCTVSWNGGDPALLHQTLTASSPASVLCGSALSSNECEVLARSSAAVIYKAGHELLNEMPDSPLRALADAGAAIALTSGYDAETEMNFSMQWVLALAVARCRLSVEQAIAACTINAAYAIQCGHVAGSLEVNKRADVLVLNVDDYRELPRRVGSNYVGMVIRNGVIVMNRTRWKVGAA